MELKINPRVAEQFTTEPAFNLFMYNGLVCCVQRNMLFGCLNGYVSIGNDHPFHGKHYNDKVHVKNLNSVKFNNNWIGALSAAFSPETELNMIGLDMYFDVHCGLTWADDHCPLLDKEIFPDLWWFGFDTNHSGDLRPMELVFNNTRGFFSDLVGCTYKDFAYVKSQVMKLADQLLEFQPKRDPAEEAAYNYFVKGKNSSYATTIR